MFHISRPTLIKAHINNITTVAAALRQYLVDTPNVALEDSARIENTVNYLRRYAANGVADIDQLNKDLDAAKAVLSDIGSRYGFPAQANIESTMTYRARGMTAISGYLLQLKAEVLEMHELATQMANSSHDKEVSDMAVQILARINSRGLPPRDMAPPDEDVE